MTEHIELGKKGEDAACEFLIDLGYTILERNWRNKFEEIDIIARDGEMLVIAEVKTRSSISFGNPELSVGLRKQRLLVNAAEAYIVKHNSDLETRFDILSVIMLPHGPKVTHIQAAFSPFD
jgi:putative endonuclease